MLDNRLRAISLFLKNLGEESKTSKRASVTVSVTFEKRCHMPSSSQSRSHACLPHDFRGKETARSLVLKQSNAKTMVLQHEKLPSPFIEYDVNNVMQI